MIALFLRVFQRKECNILSSSISKGVIGVVLLVSGERAAAKARAEIELKEKQLAQLAHQEAELDRREEQLRSQIS